MLSRFFKVKEIFEIVGGVYPHLPGHEHSFGLGVDVAYTDDVDVEVRQVAQTDQLQKEFTGPATTDNGQFEGNFSIVSLIHGFCP